MRQRIVEWLHRQHCVRLTLMILAFEAYLVAIFWLPLRDWIRSDNTPTPAAAVRTMPPAPPQPGANLVEVSRDSDFFRSQFTGGVIYVSSIESGCFADYLSDAKVESVWSSGPESGDLVICVTNTEPILPVRFTIIVYHPPEGLRARDLCVVTTDDDVAGKPQFAIVRARMAPQGSFASTFTLPETMHDSMAVAVDLDPSDASWRPHRAWGLACLETMRGHRRTYVHGDDQRIMFREFFIHTNYFKL